MDYEKKYKEALERARANYKADKEMGFLENCDMLELIFPELAESEDERIRKMCIAAVNIAASADGGLLHSEASECLAWLEEQKDKNCLACDQHLKGYLAGRKVTEEEKQKEKKPIEIDEEINRWMGCEAFPEGTNITPLPQAMEIVERTAKHFFELGEKTVPCPGGYWEGFRHGVRECQNKIRDVKDTMKEQKPWRVGANAYFTPEPKPAEWSEEDEKMLKCCLIAINHYEKTCNIGDHLPTKFNIDGYLASVDKVKSWLKSLRPQPKQEKSDYITPHKQFFKWIYDRLVNVHKENPDVDYMISFKKRIEELSFDNPSWKPTEDEERLINTSISFLKDFADKGYENAVECIDWLKSKLNGNTGK